MSKSFCDSTLFGFVLFLLWKLLSIGCVSIMILDIAFKNHSKAFNNVVHSESVLSLALNHLLTTSHKRILST